VLTTWAAALFGLCIALACLILPVGLWLDRLQGMRRLERTFSALGEARTSPESLETMLASLNRTSLDELGFAGGAGPVQAAEGLAANVRRSLEESGARIDSIRIAEPATDGIAAVLRITMSGSAPSASLAPLLDRLEAGRPVTLVERVEASRLEGGSIGFSLTVRSYWTESE
jgi:hypothetical protein